MFDKILFYDFDLKNIYTEKITFTSNMNVDYSETGRHQNILHLILSGEREYKIHEKIFTVKKGTVIFIPDGTKYSTHIKDSIGSCTGIGIKFDISGQIDNTSFNHDIYYNSNNISHSNIEDFEALANLCVEVPVPLLKIKAVLYNLIYNLISSNTLKSESLITPAITFINEHFRENLPIKTYADVCHLSESYFRKKFLEYTGMSPIAYRNKLRFQEARKLYLQNVSISEIAEVTGFYDESYFLKLYKRHTGLSLKKDSKSI